MLPSFSTRTSGTLLAFAGVVGAVALVLTEAVSDDLFFAMAGLGLLALLGLPAVRAVDRAMPTRIGVGLAVAGLAILTGILVLVGLAVALTDFDPDEAGWAFAILLIGFGATIVGLFVLGVSILVGRSLPRAIGALLAFALPAGLLIDVATGAIDDEEATAYGFWVAIGGLSLGLLLLGLALRSREAGGARELDASGAEHHAQSTTAP